MLRRRLAVVLVVAALALALALPAASALITDWWWFKEIGYQVVFARELVTRVAVFLVGGTVIAAVLYLNLRAAQRGIVPQPFVYRFGQSSTAVNLTATLRRVSLPASLALGALGGLAATPAWDLILRAIHRTPFGVVDPVFSRDVGFYVFTLPLLSTLLGFLLALVTLSLLLTAPIYLFRGDIVLGHRRVTMEPSAAVHLSLLVSALFVLTAVRLWLVDVPGLLFSTTGPLVGASFTDVHATLPALRVSAVVAAAAAVAVVVGAVRGRPVLYAAWGLATYAFVAVLGRGVIPLAIQKFVVAPTELTRETPYLRHHIQATREAWDLDRVETRDLETQAELTLADIRANGATIENVRLWDRAPLLETFGQLQEIRTYYDFIAVDDDRYWIDGRYRQVLLSPRELNAASLPTRTFINEHLTFTHGMGLTLAPVNQVTAEGLPVLFVKDLPPSTTGSLRITRPQIYYGELANEFVFVNTLQREFDHPAGEANVYAEYAGTGGVEVGGLLRRALLAARFGSSKILFSGDITNQSRALYHREILSRARKALPFLRFDGDPYLVIADDGTLAWLLDAYTVAHGYPYAQRLESGITYMRNSIKVVIDAYHGSIAAYQSEPDDPLIRTWSRIFPGLIQPLDSMPADLKAHIRYPHELYRIQTALYTTYHMDAPEDFYHREDQWQIPVQGERDGTVPLMRHIIMKLPDEPGAEFIYMVPFTPRGKDNLAAWMVARNDGAAYGGLRVYRFPRQSLVFGPRQILNRINQDTEISRQVSLWDRSGSRVIRGDLLVIPIQQALLYVQPVYLQAEGGRIPELKRVVVAHENRVVMEETLDAALTSLFGGGGDAAPRPSVEAVAAERPPAPDAGVRALAAEAFRRYEAALQAQRAGDWARYGEEIRRLGSVLERLRTGEPPGRP